MGHADLGARLKRFFSRRKGEKTSTPARELTPATPPRRAIFEEVEARILFSADVAPGVSDGTSAEVRIIDSEADAPAATPAVVTYQQQGDAWVNPYSDPYSAATAASTATQPGQQLVFIDTTVEHWEELLADVQKSQPDAEVFVLDATRDGIQQITDMLAGRNDIAAIHVISHGSAGNLVIGSSLVDNITLGAYAESISSWRGALSEDADILFYGCDVAANESGQQLIDQISTLTGADTAASTDVTGNTALGGNWTLEYTHGQIETAVILDAAAQQSWMGTMAISLDAVSSSATSGNATSLTWSHTVGSGSNGILIVEIALRYNAGASSVTYGGTALTKLSSVTDGGGIVTAELWYLKAPASGTKSIVVTLPTTHEFVAGATSFFNVNQTTPFGTAATNDGSGTTASVTASSASGEIVVAVAASRQNSSSSVGSGQTELWTEQNGTLSADAWGSTTSKAGAASVASSWTISSSEWAATAVSLKATPNNAPTTTITPTSYTATEQVSLTLQGTGITVADADNDPLTVTISTGNSSSQFTAAVGTTGVTIVSGNTSNALVLSGTAAQLNNFFAGNGGATFSFRMPGDTPAASVTMTISTSDGVASGSDTATINITAVNDAPTVTITTDPYSATEQTSLTLQGTGISIADVDAGASSVTATISVASGTLTVAAGSTGAGVSGSGTNTITLTGTLTQINNLLAGNNSGTLTYIYSGDAPPASDTLTVSVNDGGNTGTGGAKTGSDSTTINITGVNDAPVLSGTNNFSAINEDNTTSGGTLVSSLVSGKITEPDGGSTYGIAVTAVDNTNGTWQYTTNGGSNWSSFGSPSNTAARLLAADANTYIRFVPNTDWSGTATITYRAWDQTSGTAGSTLSTNSNGGSTAFSTATASPSITVNAVNDAPVVTNTSSTLAYTENAAATIIDSALTISDVDSTTLTGATITISANYSSSQDVLAFTNQLGITGSWNSGTGVLTLSGTTTVANYQTALRSITYYNSSDNPSTSTRTVTFTVNDGSATGSDTRDISVTAVNDAPVVTTTGTTLSYTENAAATAIDNALTISDADSTNMTGATITISANYSSSQDVLAFTNQLGITGSWNSGTGVLTLSGTTTVANYQTALRSITYYNSSDNPSTATRTVTFTVNDGATTGSNTRNISVTAVNDAPVVTTTGSTLAYTENAAATAIDNALTISDADSTNMTGATITISANYSSSQDVLAFTNQLGITGSWNSGTGVLTLSGTTTVANYQTALRSITYYNSSDNPSTATRTVTFTVNDGATTGSNTRNISVAAVNDAPVVTTTGSTLAYTENAAATVIDNALTVSDADNTNMTGATITISANYASGQDVLAFTNQLGITGSWNSGTGVLTLSGTTTVANYQTALRSITYYNSSDNPSTATRTVTFAVNDGSTTGSGTRDISVAAVNDAPVVTTTGSTLAYTENAAATAIDNALTVSDADSTNMTGATITISANYASGQDVLAFTNQLGITGSWNSGTGVLTLSGTTTVANYQTALRSITYYNSSDSPSTATRTVTFTVNDGSTTGSNTRNISVTAVNDAPTGADKTITTNEDTAYTFAASDFGFSDVDSGDSLSAVRFDTVPAVGTFTYSGGTVTAGTILTTAQLSTLVFTPAANANGNSYASFTFSVRDQSSVYDASPNTITFNVTPVNDAPTGADKTITTNEDTAYTFAASDFGFSDVDSGDSLSAVRFDTVPAVGTFTYSGGTVTAGTILTTAQLSTLVFTPAANANGNSYASFTFSVRDQSSVYDASPNTITFNVTPVNDAPTGTDKTITTNEDTAYTFAASDFGFSDVDSGDSLSAVRFDTVPAVGTFTYSGGTVTAGTILTTAQLS
ncbi:DUF4347 domain-containing protein, partial [Uliginosibacterium sp. H3]|nr:DUF4347 domain-containing protein [Uliginosibacterium sp. H3]